MRLKQLLITVILLAAFAAAATPELTNISLVAQGSSTVVTITASGAFRHNEYRPVDNVMFVDFPGLSAGKLLDKMKGVQMPGLAGYRVVNYAGTGGAQVARVGVRAPPHRLPSPAVYPQLGLIVGRRVGKPDQHLSGLL